MEVENRPIVGQQDGSDDVCTKAPTVRLFGEAGTRDHLTRLRTYLGSRWSKKPPVLSPVECSRRGYECVAVNRIRCVTCGHEIHIRSQEEAVLLGEGLLPQTVDLTVSAHLVHLLERGHHWCCPWRDMKVPLATIGTGGLATTAEQLFQDFTQRRAALDGALARFPIVHQQCIDALQDLTHPHTRKRKRAEEDALGWGLVGTEEGGGGRGGHMTAVERVVGEWLGCKGEQGERDGEGERRLAGGLQDGIDVLSLLAVLGWRYAGDRLEDGRTRQMLTCNYCTREFSLSGFATRPRPDREAAALRGHGSARSRPFSVGTFHPTGWSGESQQLHLATMHRVFCPWVTVEGDGSVRGMWRRALQVVAEKNYPEDGGTNGMHHSDDART
ncbi:unnamed protein product [Vitrella brassicaformis CCMP3155]|uniref:C3HC-type domain-containing protein n=2 Tax=Vitrella brassicaformis TaxID=1169539 RepID=A0A0G4G6V2_VITBC|nr:unnamed protein product [Vitrella brassicaformis CCMP3155]|eukprot:CEM24401.1 unnamed protein product [Vitrella brassicaformis CCMP3155]